MISYDQRRKAVNSLARAFGSGFTFNHIALNDQDVYSPECFYLRKGGEEERDIKSKYQRDPNVYLHIYTGDTSDAGVKIRNWATFPWDLKDEPTLDGVVVHYEVIRDEANHPTLIHEVGHWFGLLHTFQNGCSPTGDYVEDTEAHYYEDQGGIPPSGCPGEGTDNPCPGEETTPIHNFMNYSDCSNTFTGGQIEKIFRDTLIYRPRLLDPEICIPVPCPPPIPPIQ